MFQAKDLNVISLNPILHKQLTKEIMDEILKKEYKFLEEYYLKYGGLDKEYKL